MHGVIELTEDNFIVTDRNSEGNSASSLNRLSE